MYLTSLELDEVGELIQSEELNYRILCSLYYGPTCLKTKDGNSFKGKEPDNEETMDIEPTEVLCLEAILRKEKKVMDINFVIN